MRKTLLAVTAFLIVSMIDAQSSFAFSQKLGGPKDSNSSSDSSSQKSESQPFMDVGSSDNVTRMSDEEAEALKTYVEEVQQHVKQSRDGTSAMQLSTEAKTVKDAMTADTSGLKDYQTVKALEPIQNTRPLEAINAVQKTNPVNEARKIQDASSQAKKAVKMTPAKPAS